jgi:hypothetical protein
VIKTQNVDTDRLKTAIAESGLKSGFIAEQLGVSKQAFHAKVNGRSSFRASEVYVMCDLLKLNKDQGREIFFLNKLGETPTGAT